MAMVLVCALYAKASCSRDQRELRQMWAAAEGFKLLLVLGMIVCKPFFKHFLACLVLLPSGRRGVVARHTAAVVRRAARGGCLNQHPPLSRWGKARVKWFGTNMYSQAVG